MIKSILDVDPFMGPTTPRVHLRSVFFLAHFSAIVLHLIPDEEAGKHSGF